MYKEVRRKFVSWEMLQADAMVYGKTWIHEYNSLILQIMI